MEKLIQNPTPKDIKVYLGYAMAKPSNMEFEQALILTSVQFGMSKGEVSRFLFQKIDSTKIVKVKNIIH